MSSTTTRLSISTALIQAPMLSMSTLNLMSAGPKTKQRQAYVQSQCPRVKAWVERCSKDPVVLKARCGLNFDPRLPANCAAMQKMVGKYFKHQVDLLPSFVDEVLAPYDAFAAGTAPLLAFEDVDVHLFAGGLRLGDIGS